MLARSPPCCVRPKAPTTPTRPRRSWRPPNGWPPRRPSTWPWPIACRQAHARPQTPIQRTVTIGAPGTRGLRTYVQPLWSSPWLNDVLRDVRVRVDGSWRRRWVRRGHRPLPTRCTPAWWFRWSARRWLHSSACTGSTLTITARLNFQLALVLESAIGRPRPEAYAARSKKDRRRPPGTAIALRSKRNRTSRLLPHRVQSAGHLAGQPGYRGVFVAARRAGDASRANGSTRRRLRALRGALRVGTVNAGAHLRRDWQRAKVHARKNSCADIV